MKVDILAIGVHPDDIELGCGGTILKHRELGYTVALCDMTQGELGTRGSATLRIQEAHKAQNILGAQVRENCNMADGYFEHNMENINKLIDIVRKYQPDIVFANAPQDRHPDHGRAAKLIADACFYAGLVKIKTTYDVRRPKAVYHYIQDQDLKADLVVDITPYMDKKMDAVMAYASQFFDPQSTEPDTPISSLSFLESIKAKNSMYGRSIGVQYGEGFIAHRTIGVDNIFAIK